MPLRKIPDGTFQQNSHTIPWSLQAAGALGHTRVGGSIRWQRPALQALYLGWKNLWKMARISGI